MNSRQKANKALRLAKAQLLSICDTESESRNEVERYKRAFPNEIDYNIAKYGNVLIYYEQIADYFKEAGFTTTDTWSNERLWIHYQWYIGRAADML